MLDNLEKIQQIDKSNHLSNIEDAPDLISAGWELGGNFAIPSHYYNIKHLILCGMGGSGIPSKLAQSLVFSTSRIPVYTIQGYNIPQFVDNTSLVIITSYSGNTEEDISCLHDAIAKQAKIIIISTGGELASIAKKNKIPFLEFSYGSPPRAAFGYIFGLIIQIMKRLNLIEISENDWIAGVKYLKNLATKINIQTNTQQNIAKSYAEQMLGNIPIIIGSEHLSSVAYRWSTQINENAKQISWSDTLPEMNHNRICGIDSPKNLKDNIRYYILSSKNIHERTILRESILAQLFDKQRVQYETIYLQPSTNRLIESLSFILLGDYISYYLAILNGVDPTPITNIDFLKEKLNQE